MHLKLASLAFVIAAHFRKCAIVLWLLQTDVVAQPMFDSVRCTALIGLDQVIEKAKPLPADPNAIQNARKVYVERFGQPSFEKRLPDGVALTWVVTEGYSTPIAQTVVVEIIQGSLHVTCGGAF